MTNSNYNIPEHPTGRNCEGGDRSESYSLWERSESGRGEQRFEITPEEHYELYRAWERGADLVSCMDVEGKEHVVDVKYLFSLTMLKAGLQYQVTVKLPQGQVTVLRGLTYVGVTEEHGGMVILDHFTSKEGGAYYFDRDFTPSGQWFELETESFADPLGQGLDPIADQLVESMLLMGFTWDFLKPLFSRVVNGWCLYPEEGSITNQIMKLLAYYETTWEVVEPILTVMIENKVSDKKTAIHEG